MVTNKARWFLKELVHPKMKILSVFTHPHVVPNLYVFICSAEQEKKYIWKSMGIEICCQKRQYTTPYILKSIQIESSNFKL